MASLISAAALLLLGNSEPMLDISQFNTPSPEYGLAEGPDGAYLTRQLGEWGKGGQSQIWVYRDQQAVKPNWADHAASESSFFFDPESQMAYFTSDRTDPGNSDIWQMEWNAGAWDEPFRLPFPINSPETEYSPVIGPGGNLFFASSRNGECCNGEIYEATRVNESEWQVEPLPDSVNSEFGEWNLGFSHDRTTMFIESSSRFTNLTVPGDLYVSYLVDGEWSQAIALSKVNSPGSDLLMRNFGGGKFVYASSEGGDVDLVEADPEDLSTLPPKLAAVARSAGKVFLLDPETLSVTASFSVGEGPHDIASSDDGRTAITPLLGVFPAPHDGPISPSQLRWRSRPSAGYTVLDLVSGETATIQMENCKRPHGAAIEPQGRRAWITCEDVGEVREVDPWTGEVLRVFKTATGVHKVMLLMTKGMLAATNPDAGEAYLIDLTDGSIKTFSTGAGAEGLAASADETKVWVANNSAKTVCAIDVDEQQQDACFETGGVFPIALAVDSDANSLWVLHNASADLTRLSLTTGEVLDVIDLPSRPLGMAFDPLNRRIYVTLPRLNEVLSIDANTCEFLSRVDGVMESDDLDLLPRPFFQSPPDT